MALFGNHKRSVTRSECFSRFVVVSGGYGRSTLFSGLVAVICCHDPDRSSILIKISSRQRLFCKYPLKRDVSHSERFFRFRMVSTMVVSNEALESDSGLLSERSKKDQSTDRMI